MPVRLKLPDVTIFSADSAYVDFTARALARSVEQCEFGDAILCSDRAVEGPFRHVKVEPMRSVGEYSEICRSLLPELIRTRFVLLIQWDGYVVNPSAWRREFLKYDYIGAPWYGIFPPGKRVGNGGFCLRSAKLLQALKQLPPLPGKPLDQTICHTYRPVLEKDFGVRFADERVADHFSYEFGYKNAFGFHGFSNMWRHVSDDEMREITQFAWRGPFDHWKSVQLIDDTYRNGRRELAEMIYRDLRKLGAYAELKSVGEVVPASSRRPEVLATLEALEKATALAPAAKLPE